MFCCDQVELYFAEWFIDQVLQNLKKLLKKIYHLLLLCEHLVCTYNVLVDILLEHRYISIEIRNVYFQVMHFLAFCH